MPYGFRQRNAAGGVTLEITDRLPRYYGQFTVTTANTGTFTDARLIGAAAWYLPVAPFNGPIINFNPATGAMSWDWNNIPAVYRDARLFRYGVY